MIIYLASPYTSYAKTAKARDAEKHERYVAAIYAMERLLRAGLHVFSPICHSHVLGQQPIMAEYDWLPLDLDMLWRCDRLAVLRLEGWKKSEGVAAEVRTAALAQMPVDYVASGDIPAYAERMLAKHKETA